MPTALASDQLSFEAFADLFAEPLDTTPPTTTSEEEPQQSLAHVWIVAAEIKVEERVAKLADFRGSFTTVEGTRIDALEVYCRNCRRPFDTCCRRRLHRDPRSWVTVRSALVRSAQELAGAAEAGGQLPLGGVAVEPYVEPAGQSCTRAACGGQPGGAEPVATGDELA